MKSYRGPFRCCCHAAHAAHDWQHGIIHVQHHASHASNGSAHGKHRLLYTAPRCSSTLVLPAYGAIDPIAVRELERNIHVPDHARNVERPAKNMSLAIDVFTVEDHHPRLLSSSSSGVPSRHAGKRCACSAAG